MRATRFKRVANHHAKQQAALTVRIFPDKSHDHFEVLLLVLSAIGGGASAVTQLVLGTDIRSAGHDKSITLGDVIVTRPKRVSTAIGLPLLAFEVGPPSRPGASCAMLSGQCTLQRRFIHNDLVIQGAIAFPLLTFRTLATNRNRFLLNWSPFDWFFLGSGRGGIGQIPFCRICSRPVISGRLPCRCSARGTPTARSGCGLWILDAVGTTAACRHRCPVGVPRPGGSRGAGFRPCGNSDLLRLVSGCAGRIGNIRCIHGVRHWPLAA